MDKARSAVPVWIMPLSRVFDSFDPGRERFDVVIIDEASQADITALVALYMGRQVAVVGDHQQVSPLDVGRDLGSLDSLIAQHLADIPSSHLYDGKTSIYDLARQSFGSTIPLMEHFRCVPEIIEFSNGLSYNWTIKPLRDGANAVVGPPTVEFYVSAVQAQQRRNRKEALWIAALLQACIEQPAYSDSTFGVISLVGEEQAIEIETLLHRELPPSEIHKRQIVCGNAARFQGNERNVIFLSMVDAPSGDGPLALRSQDLFKQRFNVAASRARDQLWLVHSLDPGTDLQPADLRRRLIEHVRDPGRHLRELSREQARTESEFEREVLRALVAKNYRVRSQIHVGYYRIDMIVENSAGKKVAIECDGERFIRSRRFLPTWPGKKNPGAPGFDLHQDPVEQEWYREPDRTLDEVMNELSRLGVDPLGPADSLITVAAMELKEAVIRRAFEIANERRVKWSPFP